MKDVRPKSEGAGRVPGRAAMSSATVSAAASSAQPASSELLARGLLEQAALQGDLEELL
jgi:hypothetical protein